MNAGGREHRPAWQQVKSAAHDANILPAWHGEHPLNIPGESGGGHYCRLASGLVCRES